MESQPQNHEISALFRYLFVCLDSLHPSQQFFSYLGTSLPGLNQY